MVRLVTIAVPDGERRAPVPVAEPPVGWKVVGAVVRGVSHERLGMPCQDAQDYQVLPGGTLLVALADGAGSASFSDQGARCAVNEALRSMASLLESGLPADNDRWRSLLSDIFTAARKAVLDLAQVNAAEGASLEKRPSPENRPGQEELDPGDEMAAADGPTTPGRLAEMDDLQGPEDLTKFAGEGPVEPQTPAARAYATTLTCAIASADRFVVGQIGDGVAVAGKGDELVAVTHLQRGEYANETHFLTQTDALEHLEVAVIEQPVSELAVMSDGLIRLALKMPGQEPHAPFFRPLFRVTASIGEKGGAPDETEAARQLSAFLGSERVNARTDDDKSLVLAVRAAPLRESAERMPPDERTMGEDYSAGTAGSRGTGRPAKVKGSGEAPSALDWERK